ncbi:MAG TPA: response regulator [Gemmatimonadaceae bacterium]|nr:response regulator [Gemmatimonadaceae bacterium]
MPHQILVVEDSTMVSGGLRILLEAHGYEVAVAATAADAIAWKSERPADLMLLDLTLPDGDGLEVIGGLQARGVRPSVIFALTGHADSATEKRCLEAGCDGVLIKPVPIQDLIRIVSEKVA